MSIKMIRTKSGPEVLDEGIRVELSLHYPLMVAMVDG
jgi:hypothetical protein